MMEGIQIPHQHYFIQAQCSQKLILGPMQNAPTHNALAIYSLIIIDYYRIEAESIRTTMNIMKCKKAAL